MHPLERDLGASSEASVSVASASEGHRGFVRGLASDSHGHDGEESHVTSAKRLGRRTTGCDFLLSVDSNYLSLA